MRWIAAALVMTAFLMTTADIAAAQDAPAIVKQRQAFMDSLYVKYFKGFFAIVKGESSDLAGVPAKAQEAAAAIRTIPSLFPPGTGHDVVPESRAKPEIWTKRADFEANVAALAAATEKLGDVAKSGDLDAFKVQLAAAGQACGACHGGPKKAGGPFRFEEP
jgi:cytochrome c556